MLVGGDVERSHLLVADLDAGGIFVDVEPGGHHQAGTGGGGGDVVEDQIEGLERAAGPIAADLAEEAMLDRVPSDMRNGAYEMESMDAPLGLLLLLGFGVSVPEFIVERMLESEIVTAQAPS